MLALSRLGTGVVAGQHACWHPFRVRGLAADGGIAESTGPWRVRAEQRSPQTSLNLSAEAVSHERLVQRPCFGPWCMAVVNNDPIGRPDSSTARTEH